MTTAALAERRRSDAWRPNEVSITIELQSVFSDLDWEEFGDESATGLRHFYLPLPPTQQPYSRRGLRQREATFAELGRTLTIVGYCFLLVQHGK